MTPTLSHIEIVVSDMAAALAFYRRLGLDIDPAGDDQPHVEVPLPGGLTLAFDTEDTIRSFDADWAPPKGGHRHALAFTCAGPAEVDRLHAELTAAGYASHREPWDAVWGQRYAVVHDPDGNTVDLCAPLPTT